jgi:hypothetical protein
MDATIEKPPNNTLYVPGHGQELLALRRSKFDQPVAASFELTPKGYELDPSQFKMFKPIRAPIVLFPY